MAKSGSGDPWEYSLRKYLLLLATLVATVTYSAGFNPPGGVWQDTIDPATTGGHLAGDPIIRATSYPRYLAFFYCNATAFASSLVVIVLLLILSVQHDHRQAANNNNGPTLTPSPGPLRTLRFVMTLDLLSLLGAYAAGTCRDTLTTAYSVVLVSGVAAYVAGRTALATWRTEAKADTEMDRARKVLMLLATFAVSVTYAAGLSALPGGFWDHGADAGRAVLEGGPHRARLKAFFVCNTTAFVASLLIVVVLLDKRLREADRVRVFELYGFILVALSGLIGAYSAGSCREVDTTVYVNALIGAVLVAVLVQVAIVKCFGGDIVKSIVWKRMEEVCGDVARWVRERRPAACLGGGEPQQGSTGTGVSSHEQRRKIQALEKARSLVLLLATLTAAITYQAGLDPPGGLWEEDGINYIAGDPILLTRNPKRYKAFFYCNSVAFVASLVAIVLVRKKTLHRHNALEAAMVLVLFGLIGAYAAGSCRDVHTSVNAMALAGAVLVYVVIHIVFFTLDHDDDATDRIANDPAFVRKLKAENELVEKRRKRLLLFAILAATITYQAGLTPPSGFLLKDAADQSGHRAGDPVLLNNYPKRYKAFFYCNSVSFMLSIALIILLVNKNLYRPAIRSNALSVCTAAGMFGLVGAYAAGSTQHIKTSIYIFALAAVVLGFVALLVIVFLVIHKRQHEENARNNNASARVQDTDMEMAATADAGTEEESPASKENDPPADQENGGSTTEAAGTELIDPPEEKKIHAKRKYLMLLGILVASVTYQAGLEPPGGVWQSDDADAGHTAGNPIMHDNRHPRYLAFFYSNSISFVASIVVIVLLLPERLHKKIWWLTVMNLTIVLDLLGLLIAYAAGSSRSWKTSGYVTALVIAVLGYFVVHVVLSCFSRFCNKKTAVASSASQSNGENGVELQAPAIGS